MVARVDSGLELEPTAELPEHLRPSTYGEHEVQPLRMGGVIRLTQVRLGVNPEIKSLSESIENSGLLNIVDVVIISRDALTTYIDFVNRIWGSNHIIDEYEPDEHGLYKLLIAGHSRYEAISIIETRKSKEARKLGFDTDPGDATIFGKIHYASTPEEIMDIQLAENIHKEPAEERRAVAIVELYRYGEENGLWTSKEAFLKRVEGKFTRNALDRALIFQQLPDHVRDLVMQGRYKYGVAIEYGRLVEPLKQYYARFYFKADYEELDIETQQEMVEKVSIEIAEAVDKARTDKKSIAKAKVHVDKRIEDLRNNIAVQKDEADNLLIMSDPSSDFRLALQKDRRRLAELVARIADGQMDSVVTAVTLNQAITSDPEAREAIEELIGKRVARLRNGLSEEVLGVEVVDGPDTQALL